jgi:hypothetical protein
MKTAGKWKSDSRIKTPLGHNSRKKSEFRKPSYRSAQLIHWYDLTVRERQVMSKLLKSVLKTAVYLLDQAEDVADDVRGRVSNRVERASDRVSDLRDRARDLYRGEDHTLRNVLTFAAGLGVGVLTAMLFAPASGEETRGQIGEKVHDIGGRMRERFSESQRTGTESV